MTAYEMRISDWSSDVCSSDLVGHLGKEAREPGDGPAGADAADDGVDFVLHLLPDLRPGGGLMGLRIGGVAELVDEDGAGLGRDALCHVLVILGVALADVGAGQDHLGAERAQVKDLFLDRKST